MEFWTSVRTIVRRWYVVVPSLLVFVTIAAFLVTHVSTSYQAAGSVVFLRENQPSDPKVGPVNPLQTLDYQSLQIATIEAEVANDPSFKARYVAAGGTTNYTVTAPATQTPIVPLTTTAATPEQALSTYNLLVDQLRADLQQRQSDVGAPKETWASASDLSVPSTAEPQTGTRTKALILVTGMGLVVSLGLAFLVDSLAAVYGTRRRRPGSGSVPVDDEPGRDPAPVVEPVISPVGEPVIEPWVASDDPEDELDESADELASEIARVYSRPKAIGLFDRAPIEVPRDDSTIDLDAIDGNDVALDELVNGALADEDLDHDDFANRRRRAARPPARRYPSHEATGP